MLANNAVRCLLLFASIFSVAVAQAGSDWTLVNDQSSLRFVSVKKEAIGEIHKFRELTGSINKKGEFTLQVDLKSVDTQIEIRDQRMQEFLFESDKFPSAEITGKLNDKVIESLKTGEPTPVTTTINIELHGKTVTQEVALNAVKLSKKRLLVSNIDPIIINAEQFDLVPGVEKLKELAALPSITLAVPVSVSLVFSR